MVSVTSEYALRALAVLAQLDRVIGGHELAQRTGIPPKYLSKIMLALRNGGLIVATRGTGGGYMLQRPAHAIHLIDIVVLFEGPPVWPHCLIRPDQECSQKNPCSAHRYWARVRSGLLDFLEQTTIADIAGNKTQLSGLSRETRRQGRIR